MTTALRRPRRPVRRVQPGTRRLRIVPPPPPQRRERSWLGRVLPVVPLVLVNAFAVLGQVLYGITAYGLDWPWQYRLIIAIGAAISVESIANVVQWHSHDALLRGATSTAARLRRVSYLIAFSVGALNYSHFAGPDWQPTAIAVMFGAFSASTPWLWGMHTRRVHQIQLLREGHADSTGATFSAERWRWFPWRTFGALRYSIEHSITNPGQAWVAYNRARAARPARPARSVPKAQHSNTATPRPKVTPPASPPVPPPPPDEQLPDLATGPGDKPDPVDEPDELQQQREQRLPANVLTDDEALARLRQWVTDNGRLPRTRAERRTATGCGGDRADRFVAQVAAEGSQP